MLAAEDARQEMPLLRLGTQGDQGVAQQVDSEQVVFRAFGRAGAGEFLGEHHLFHRGQATTPVFRRPGHRDQASAGQGPPPVPGELFPLVGRQRPGSGPPGRQVLGHKLPDPVAERFRFGWVADVHCAPRPQGRCLIAGRICGAASQSSRPYSTVP